MHIEVYPSSVFGRIRGPVEEINLALVPALVTLVHVGEIQRGLVGKRDPPFIAIACVWWVPIVPDVDGYLDALLLPLDHVWHGFILGKFEGAAQNHVFTQVGSEMLWVVLNIS